MLKACRLAAEGCPGTLEVRINGDRINGVFHHSYKWGILGLEPTDPRLLLTRWNILVGGGLNHPSEKIRARQIGSFPEGSG